MTPDMSDDEFIASFEGADLSNESFHHADHVRMAFLYLRRYPAVDALRRFSISLARFAAAKGKPERYNETITWAFLFLIRERIARGGSQPLWPQFANENADLLNWKENILKKYYRDETLASDFARTTFVFPDKVI
ncbi:MAG: hypothetical protein ACRD2U_12575 [Terriglobales bacterium]